MKWKGGRNDTVDHWEISEWRHHLMGNEEMNSFEINHKKKYDTETEKTREKENRSR